MQLISKKMVDQARDSDVELGEDWGYLGVIHTVDDLHAWSIFKVSGWQESRCVVPECHVLMGTDDPQLLVDEVAHSLEGVGYPGITIIVAQGDDDSRRGAIQAGFIAEMLARRIGFEVEVVNWNKAHRDNRYSTDRAYAISLGNDAIRSDRMRLGRTVENVESLQYRVNVRGEFDIFSDEEMGRRNLAVPELFYAYCHAMTVKHKPVNSVPVKIGKLSRLEVDES